jgi:hypothetical protein
LERKYKKRSIWKERNLIPQIGCSFKKKKEIKKKEKKGK